MKHPQVIVLDADGWIARQLRELADEGRWLIRMVRAVDAAKSLAQRNRASVLLLQFELADEKQTRLAMMSELHRLTPDMPVVAIADVKLSDTERAAWTAAVLDLGARYVLFPPITKTVLEDLVSGLMTATIRRVVGRDAAFGPLPQSSRLEEVIDLADEEANE
ncbi:MAG TPA: hypothetical protein VLM40_11275 [Gemmata sp.]|nr:hypothetical protein [Gemmata sp.]